VSGHNGPVHPLPLREAGAFPERLVQPDQRSCGAAVLVVARMLLDPAYAELVATGRHPGTGVSLPGDVAARFRYEVLGMHHRVTGAVDVSGRVQLPWPQALGTPPWAVARQLSGTGRAALPAVPHATHLVRGDLDGLFDHLADITATRRPVPVYVGNRLSPRHVVLALGTVDGRLRCYEPSLGLLVDVDRAAFTSGRLRLAGWDRPWFVVTPDVTTRASSLPGS
jgi:hypothetical protein